LWQGTYENQPRPQNGPHRSHTLVIHELHANHRAEAPFVHNQLLHTMGDVFSRPFW
jgi:hypothetical protein